MGVCNCSMFCCTLLYINSSIAIILMGFALLNLSSWCLVMVEQLFLAVPRGCLQFVIVVFPDHTYIPFLREFIFEGIDTLPQFCTWVLGDENKGVTYIAHNFGGYDGQFILHYILEYGTEKPEVIMHGNTILRMKVGRVTFLDSYQFLHMRLANFPDTFGLTEMKKGYFPHLSNTLANQKYVGPYFPVDMYNPGQMSVKDRETF